MKIEERFLRIADFNRLYMFQLIYKQLKKEGAVFIGEKEKTHIFLNDAIYEVSDPIYFKKHEKEIKNYKSFISYFYSFGGCYMSFILNGYYYYYQIDTNPFFNGLFKKIKINEKGEYVGNRYCYNEEEITSIDPEYIKMNKYRIFSPVSVQTLRRWAYDFYKNDFKKFLNMAECETITEKKRVFNLYNNGSHIERVKDKSINNVLIDKYTKKEKATF